MAQLYKVDRHVLGHLDSNEFRIDTRVSTKEIKKEVAHKLKQLMNNL